MSYMSQFVPCAVEFMSHSPSSKGKLSRGVQFIDFFKMSTDLCVQVCDAHGMCMSGLAFISAPSDCASQSVMVTVL